MGRIVEVIAAIVSVGAGVYLLSKNSVPVTVGGQQGQSWLEILAHGIGAYFIARGIWMFSQVGVERTIMDAVRRIADTDD